MEIVNARKEHKNYILDANKKINKVSGLSETRLDKFIDNDLFSNNPQFKCLVALENNNPVGMCIYSNMYMANYGRGYYLANVYVEKNFREKHIFTSFLKTIEQSDKYNFMLAFVGDENKLMQNIVTKLGANDTGLKSYFLKLNK